MNGASAVMDRSTVHGHAPHGVVLQPEGLFRIIDWGSEKAYKAAQAFWNRLQGKGQPIGEDEWQKYFEHADRVYENKNVGVFAGLGVLLQAGAGLVALSTNVIQVASTQAVFGGPASLTTNNKAYLGVGTGIVYCTLTGAVTGGTTTVLPVSSLTGGSIAAGDILIMQDSTSYGAQGSNVEYVEVSSYSAGNITLTKPVRYSHSSATYVTKSGAPTATDMVGGSKCYKGIDTGFPTYTTPSSKPTLTWQTTYSTADAQFAWNECLIAAVPNASSPPNAGSGSNGVTTIPASSVLLATSVWYPSPLTKGASIVSQQYQFQLSSSVQ